MSSWSAAGVRSFSSRFSATAMPPRQSSAPAGGRQESSPAARPPSSGGTSIGLKMPRKPVRLSLFQSMRAAAGAKTADRQQGRAARSAAEISGELGLGRDLNIFHAAQVGSYNLLRAVLDAGQPVNSTDETRRTALHHAASQVACSCMQAASAVSHYIHA